MNTSPSLTLSKLGCIKGGRQLFKDVDCSLHAGHWLYVAGANGVGKTSLLRLLCGLAPIEAGDIFWNQQSIQSQRETYRQDLCYLGHLNALQESMSVQENLLFTSALGGVAIDQQQILEVLARFGLRGRSQQLVRHLSQGQKRRVALSRLVLSQARLWVLDEPYVAMDEGGIRMLAELISSHLDGGGLVVLTSHQKVAVGKHTAQMLELKAA
ncbi:MAG: cytochrome c biogenesis heme-transporting ATPase CcmA [Rhodoferax sp.]|uniref:cytochrome c biogenesis heme-transporting ATPase CcmA n=1 Tax=Rhodoferax sp. TaxID=50421 RepID=UPI001B405C80|nr:cytochrome c biogenesis heme-transporting ATPase CcmA [Rhodoferax sp.]MBP9736512.1 cytochrome c biogenesis heme-transporting ATPase CcmA [Rhodoferax sp.]